MTDKECRKHAWTPFIQFRSGYWVRKCTKCWHTERKNELSFTEWLWNLRPWA